MARSREKGIMAGLQRDRTVAHSRIAVFKVEKEAQRKRTQNVTLQTMASCHKGRRWFDEDGLRGPSIGLAARGRKWDQDSGQEHVALGLAFPHPPQIE